MAATGIPSATIGVPIKLLLDAEGHVVTIELKNGEIYRGVLVEVEETMNCQLKEVTSTGRDGRVVRMENVFLRGGLVKFIVLPEALKSSPLFKKVQTMHAKRVASDSKSKAKAAGTPGGRTKRVPPPAK